MFIATGEVQYFFLHDVVLFFKLYRALLSFVNERLQVIPDHLASPEEFLSVEV